MASGHFLKELSFRGALQTGAGQGERREKMFLVGRTAGPELRSLRSESDTRGSGAAARVRLDSGQEPDQGAPRKSFRGVWVELSLCHYGEG